jgi:hypothetical protein
VMHFLGGVIADDSVQRKRALLEQRVASYATRPGLGLGACFLKSTAEFIGWHMLRPREYRQYAASGALLEPVEHAELGYRLARRFWGQGYATEMSRALVRHGLERLGLLQIVAFVSPEHARLDPRAGEGRARARRPRALRGRGRGPLPHPRALIDAERAWCRGMRHSARSPSSSAAAVFVGWWCILPFLMNSG